MSDTATNADTASAGDGGGSNSDGTASDAATATDTKTKKQFVGPLPTVVNWENNPNLANGKEQNSQLDASVDRIPLNPVVDDVAQFLDDDQYKLGKYGGRAGKLFPKEKEEIPTMWPAVAGGIFVLSALVLFISTAYKNYRKRKDYQSIPAAAATGMSLVV